MLKMAFVRM